MTTKQSILFSFLAIFAIASFSFTNRTNGGETVTINTEKSVITWKGAKVTGEHAGTIAVKTGSLIMENGKLSGGSFAIDMSSIKVTDMEGAYAEKLAGHLKSPDFFGVDKYPIAKLVITKVSSRGTEGDYKVTGNLTIKETTKEIKFNAKLAEGIATAEIVLDRTDFDVRYGSGSFFDNLGDKTIYDEFDLAINLVLN